LKIKCVDSRVNVQILTSASVTFTLTTVQVPILALTHTKRITVYLTVNSATGWIELFLVVSWFSLHFVLISFLLFI
jgi:hypothetical protein